MKIHLLLLLLFLINGINASPLFRHITMEDGLTSSQVTSILQDKKGYIWIGTTEGLNRYNGHSFVHYLPLSDNPGSIQGSHIDRLFEDETGGIWIFFTSGEISRYNPSTCSFQNFSKEWLQQQLRVYGNPTCLSATTSGNVFIGTENGLLTYNYKENRLKRFNQTGSTIASSPINCFYTAPDGTLWTGTLTGFSRYDQNTNSFTDYLIRTTNQQDTDMENLNGVHAIYIDTFDYMWLGTGKKGVFRSTEAGERELFESVGQKDLRIYQFMETQKRDFWIGHNKGATRISRANRVSLRSESFFDTPDYLAPTGEYHVRSIQEDPQGTVWINNNHFYQGLFYFSEDSHRMLPLESVPENPYSIGSNQISCLYINPSGHLWVGHPYSGISHCNLNPPLFNYTDKASPGHILALYEDSEANLWVGTTNGLKRINRTTSQTDKLYAFSPVNTPTSLSGKMISSIYEDKEKNLWISYQDAMPDRISLVTLQKQSFTSDMGSSHEPSIRNIIRLCADKKGQIWMLTRQAELIRYDVANKKSSFYAQPFSKIQEEEPSYREIYSLCTDNDSGIWIGTDGEGLRFLDTVTETFTNYKHIPTNKNSLSSNYIHCLYSDSSGILWIGTNVGMDRYDKQTGEFTRFSIQDGLAGNIVQDIREGEANVLFISTNKGLSRFDIKNCRFINYSTVNGLLSNEFIAGVSCKRKSGELMFGSNAGILSFMPSEIQKDNMKTPTPVLITRTLLKGKRGSQDLQIEFITFDYTFPQSMRYAYRLTGYDTDWRETDAVNPSAFYRQLPSGKYNFQVKASYNGQVWSEPVSVEIKVMPIWWRTIWFALLTLAGIILLLFIAYKKRIRWYLLRQEELELKIQERTQLLEQAKEELIEKDRQKTRFFMNVSHELRTPLTIIKGLTENLESSPKQQETVTNKETLQTISRNTDRLIRHVNELLDLSILNKGLPSPHIVRANLNGFLTELAETFVPIANKYQILFTYSIDPGLTDIFFDKKIVEQALYNLLSNAFKYTPDGGQIHFTATLNIDSQERTVIMKVEDNGIGIPADCLCQIFDPYYKGKSVTFRRSESSGIGLAYTKDIIGLLLGTISCQSEPGKGSLFTITLPASSDTYPAEWIEENPVMTITPATADENRYTLLFIEDNEDLCSYLADSFSEEYNVVISKNGKKGYEKAVEILPDLIVSDVMMPVMDGLRCCEALKTNEHTAHIPVILLTALAEESRQLDGYGSGADDYLPKPFSIAILKAKIKNLIARRDQLFSYFREQFKIEENEDDFSDPDKIFVSKATKVVLDNLQNQEFDIGIFCSQMAMSRASLFRKLKSTTDCSASAFTRNIRIKYAAGLLEQKRYTIGEIAIMAGFSDSNYFSRCFKDIYGMTPSDYAIRTYLPDK